MRNRCFPHLRRPGGTLIAAGLVLATLAACTPEQRQQQLPPPVLIEATKWREVPAETGIVGFAQQYRPTVLRVMQRRFRNAFMERTVLANDTEEFGENYISVHLAYDSTFGRSFLSEELPEVERVRFTRDGVLDTLAMEFPTLNAQVANVVPRNRYGHFSYAIAEDGAVPVTCVYAWQLLTERDRGVASYLNDLAIEYRVCDGDATVDDLLTLFGNTVLRADTGVYAQSYPGAPYYPYSGFDAEDYRADFYGFAQPTHGYVGSPTPNPAFSGGYAGPAPGYYGTPTYSYGAPYYPGGVAVAPGRPVPGYFVPPGTAPTTYFPAGSYPPNAYLPGDPLVERGENLPMPPQTSESGAATLGTTNVPVRRNVFAPRPTVSTTPRAAPSGPEVVTPSDGPIRLQPPRVVAPNGAAPTTVQPTASSTQTSAQPAPLVRAEPTPVRTSTGAYAE